MLSRSAPRTVRRTRPTRICRDQAVVCPGSRGNSPSFPAPRSANTRSSTSSTRWKSRQGKDSFARDAKLQGLKSRAAFKLLEIDAKYKIFKTGQTVVDLGYAPGSWSQVAVERTKPSGRIVGIDIIPAQPPKGVSTFQGNFLSAGVQAEVKRFLLDPDRGRPKQHLTTVFEDSDTKNTTTLISEQQESYIDHERHMDEDGPTAPSAKKTIRKTYNGMERMVDVVLSDMSEPWPQTTGFWKRTLSDPYIRMMNTSGINFKDHAGSMV
ncbi:2' O-ribose methyltransferase [Cadophora gregata]|uniref:2' O-ribose methyltransferase n=1 Tax=Cadophora gregata TaxID=51156 RepID=UPI0026DD40C4|nr:2' O-ribose methyltransferase [Cadophora gregata]KAK0108377.1 2' O-ribose methyltransferase [Cadophora gregata]